jgi:hypothetical protein
LTAKYSPLTLDALARADLELPLRLANLGVGSRNFDAGIDASTEMALHDVTLDNLAGTDTAVVGTLRSGEALQIYVSLLQDLLRKRRV